VNAHRQLLPHSRSPQKIQCSIWRPKMWSSEARADFEAFVREGGGLVAVHAVDNHAAYWVEYNKMISVGGWGL